MYTEQIKLSIKQLKFGNNKLCIIRLIQCHVDHVRVYIVAFLASHILLYFKLSFTT